jgi:hypothetical protein
MNKSHKLLNKHHSHNIKAKKQNSQLQKLKINKHSHLSRTLTHPNTPVNKFDNHLKSLFFLPKMHFKHLVIHDSAFFAFWNSSQKSPAFLVRNKEFFPIISIGEISNAVNYPILFEDLYISRLEKTSK